MNKRQQVIELLNNNPNKTRKEYIDMICSEIGMSKAGASTYYYFAADSGKLTFDISKRERMEVEKEVKMTITEPVKNPNLVKAVVGSLADKPLVTDMTVEEIADKTAKRSKSKKNKKIVETVTSNEVDDFDPVAARAEVDAINEDIDNLVIHQEDHPSSLTTDEAAALI